MSISFSFFFGGGDDNLTIGDEVRFELWIFSLELPVCASRDTRLITCQDSNRGFIYKNRI